MKWTNASCPRRKISDSESHQLEKLSDTKVCAEEVNAKHELDIIIGGKGESHLVQDLRIVMRNINSSSRPKLPKGDVSIFYYKSKCLELHNICDIKTNNCQCYVWDETNGKRGVKIKLDRAFWS